MKNSTAQKSDKPVTYGRPRLLTHDEIIAAAVEMGLDNLTMKKLSTALNVGTATLYQYFDSRKSLIRAAAIHSLGDIALPEDKDQHWTALTKEYVHAIQGLLADNPSFIFSYQYADYGFEVQFKLIEPFVAALVKRGFSPSEGMELFNLVGMTAFAGAVEAVRQQEFEFQDETMEIVVKRQFARLDPAEFPNVAQSLDKLVNTPRQKMDFMLEHAFRSIAASRGETYPLEEQ